MDCKEHQFGDFPPTDKSNSMEVNVYHGTQLIRTEQGHMIDIAYRLVTEQNVYLDNRDAYGIAWTLAHQLRDYGRTDWKGYSIVRIKEIPEVESAILSRRNADQ